MDKGYLFFRNTFPYQFPFNIMVDIIKHLCFHCFAI